MPRKSTRQNKVKPRRERGIPVQAYFSELEHKQLKRLAKQRGKTVSGLMRYWIKSAIARSQPRARDAAVVDPRQLGMFEGGGSAYESLQNTGVLPGAPSQPGHAAPKK